MSKQAQRYQPSAMAEPREKRLVDRKAHPSIPAAPRRARLAGLC